MEAENSQREQAQGASESHTSPSGKGFLQCGHVVASSLGTPEDMSAGKQKGGGTIPSSDRYRVWENRKMWF